MAVLQVSNNLIHMDGSPVKNTTAGHFSSKVDYGIKINDNTTSGVIFKNEAPSGDTVWYQFDAYVSSNPSSGDDGGFMHIRDVNGSPLFTIEIYNGFMYGRAIGSTGTSDTAAGPQMSGSTLMNFKIKVQVTGAQVVCEFFFNGTSVGVSSRAHTGDRGVARSISFDLLDAIYAPTITISSIVVSDSDLLNNGFTKLVPASAGTDTDFTGDGVASLSDDDMTTGGLGSAVGDKSSYNLTAYAGGVGIHSFVASAVISAGISAINYRFYLLIGGVRYYGTTKTAPVNSTELASQEWTLDPSDLAAWTQAKINATQVGVEIVA